MNRIEIWNYIILGIATFIMVVGTTPLMRKLAIKIDFLDYPNIHHKSHLQPTPYLGGLAILIGIMGTISIALSLQGNRVEILIASFTIAPSILLAFIGLVDDKYNLSPIPRFLGQNLIAFATCLVIVSREELGSPTGNTIIDLVISVIWVVGITNAINFFDNVDGGAAGTITIIASGILIISILNQQILLSAISVVIASASLGFLFWNFEPAKIYMGDTGSLFLGFLLAILTIRLDSSTNSLLSSFLIPFLLLAVPILDTSVAVLSRLKRKISPFQGGKDHLSHRLQRIGLTKRRTVYVLWLGSILFCALAITVLISEQIKFLVSFLAIALWTSLLIFFLRTPDSD